ncbi:head completion/stabilization protein [Escherichia coli]|uniref:head completion/stabilization protein n=1 Tax=Escherichia coli TaxID=562 RepID=UPI000693661C|nr:head completion/stabilization protein [Escherichia coli]EEX1963048.1 head protein [Escherichia coli]ELM8986942.1 head completion/stabilization protein [Escherichia coli]
MFDGKSISYQQGIIRNDGFWPDINAGDFEKSRTIPAVTSHDTVLNALLCAITEINAELESRKENYQRQGYQSAEDIPGYQAVTPGDDGQQEIRTHIAALYIRAVYARAKADLIPEAVSVGRRDGLPSQEATETRRSLLTEAAMAIRALTGRRRASVCLID